MLNNEKAFTLIEMLIVLTIIAVLIILIVPNIANKSKQVHETGCDALQKTVQAQVSAYQLETGKTPTTLEELKSKKFITEDQLTCQNGKSLQLNEGIVSIGN